MQMFFSRINSFFELIGPLHKQINRNFGSGIFLPSLWLGLEAILRLVLLLSKCFFHNKIVAKTCGLFILTANAMFKKFSKILLPILYS